MFFYRYDNLYAARKGAFKAHFITEGEYGQGSPRMVHVPPLLYHLGEDPGERFDVADRYPEVIADIVDEVEAHRRALEPRESIFDIRPPR